MKIKYEELKEEIKNILPEKYITGIVKEYAIKTSDDDASLAREGLFNTNLLTHDHEYVIYDAKNPEIKHNFKNGDLYIINILRAIQQYGDTDLIPTMFIYAFFRSLDAEEMKICKFTRAEINEIIAESEQEIIAANYGIANSRFRQILPLYADSYPFFLKEVKDIPKCKTTKEVAAAIVSAVDNVLSVYEYEYWSIPEETMNAYMRYLAEKIDRFKAER